MIEIPITIMSDENGYIDRECPNENCLYQFKIKLKDWEEKVSDDEVHCPMCGFVATSDKWWTEEQNNQMAENMKNAALSYVQKEIEKAFKKLERSTRHNKYCRISYKPGKRITYNNNPIGQMPEWEQEIKCEKCGTTYSVIGSAFFCPCCGYNSAKASFYESLNSIERMIDSLADICNVIGQNYSRDVAETMCRNMVEDSLGNCVSAFQKFAECVFKGLSSKSVRVNDFQMVDKGSALFRENCGHSYEAWLLDEEIDYLRMMFQRRHIFEHNNGMVDQMYLDKSGDISYSIGQRVVLRETDIKRLIALLRKLGDGLLSLK